MADVPGKKKLVSAAPLTDEEMAKFVDNQSDWTPTPEAKKQATTFRIIALVAWVAAIGLEAWGIFGILKQNPVNMVLLIVILVLIAALAITGSLLWKQSNRLDPARKSETVRFFVQNQLGAIMTIIAFVPLIVLIFLDKNMDGKQKALAGGIGIVLAVVATYFGVSINPPSVESNASQTNEVVQLTGRDLVFWTTDGNVYHLCQQASAVNRQSKDNEIHSGTVAQAVAAGKQRLTLEVDTELKQCGFPPRGSSVAPSTATSSTPAASPSASPTK